MKKLFLMFLVLITVVACGTTDQVANVVSPTKPPEPTSPPSKDYPCHTKDDVEDFFIEIVGKNPNFGLGDAWDYRWDIDTGADLHAVVFDLDENKCLEQIMGISAFDMSKSGDMELDYFTGSAFFGVVDLPPKENDRAKDFIISELEKCPSGDREEIRAFGEAHVIKVFCISEGSSFTIGASVALPNFAR